MLRRLYEETVYLNGATVIRYLKCSRIKSVREMLMQTYSGNMILYLFLICQIMKKMAGIFIFSP